MAFQRRRTSFRRFARKKRQGAWTGIGPINLSMTTVGTTYSVYIWSDLDSRALNMAGKGVHQRTLLWVIPNVNDLTAQVTLAMSLSVYQTDAVGNVPTGAIVPPYTSAASLFERSPLAWHAMEFDPPVNAGAGRYAGSSIANFSRDVQVKRKMDDTDALLLTLEHGLPFGGTQSIPFRVQLFARTYVTW